MSSFRDFQYGADLRSLQILPPQIITLSPENLSVFSSDELAAINLGTHWHQWVRFMVFNLVTHFYQPSGSTLNPKAVSLLSCQWVYRHTTNSTLRTGYVFLRAGHRRALNHRANFTATAAKTHTMVCNEHWLVV